MHTEELKQYKYRFCFHFNQFTSSVVQTLYYKHNCSCLNIRNNLISAQEQELTCRVKG